MTAKERLLRSLRNHLACRVSGIAVLAGLPVRPFEMVWSTTVAAAGTHGGVIYVNHDWFREHPTDYGALTHEYVHLIQAVPGGTCPSDVIEGIADAMRYKRGEYDPWWSPSPMAAKIAALSPSCFRTLSRRMASGTYEAALLECR